MQISSKHFCAELKRIVYTYIWSLCIACMYIYKELLYKIGTNILKWAIEGVPKSA
jgi:hypothetical protein